MKVKCSYSIAAVYFLLLSITAIIICCFKAILSAFGLQTLMSLVQKVAINDVIICITS